jgi:hypothetical protein
MSGIRPPVLSVGLAASAVVLAFVTRLHANEYAVTPSSSGK